MPESIPGAASLPVRAPLSDPRALQILTAEHSSLSAGRTLAYNEAFARASMFLSFLSATLIVIGFLIGTQGLSSALVPVIAVLLVANLFIGAATVGRLIDASAEELQCVRGMNRVRNAYREIAPGLEPYFITGFHDDARGVLATYGGITTSSSVLRDILHGLTTTIGMVATIDVMVFGTLCALIAIGFGIEVEVGVVLGLIGFSIGMAIFAVIGMRAATGRQRRAKSQFPTPDKPPDSPQAEA